MRPTIGVGLLVFHWNVAFMCMQLRHILHILWAVPLVQSTLNSHQVKNFFFFTSMTLWFWISLNQFHQATKAAIFCHIFGIPPFQGLVGHIHTFVDTHSTFSSSTAPEIFIQVQAITCIEKTFFFYKEEVWFVGGMLERNTQVMLQSKSLPNFTSCKVESTHRPRYLKS